MQKKTANIKSIMKLSKLNLEYNHRGIASPTTNIGSKINFELVKKLIIGSLAILIAFLSWLFLLED